MKLSKLGRGFVRKLDTTTRVTSALACACVAIMMLIIISNVFGRFFLGMPLKGAAELVELIMVVIAFFAIVHTQQEGGNVNVDLVLMRLRGSVKSIMIRFGFFVGLVIYGLITYQSIIDALWYAQDLDKMTTLLYIPLAPFRFVMVLGCFLLCLRLLLDMFRPLPPENGGKEV